MSISVIVPVYNEEQNIKKFLERLIPVLKKINKDYEIIFVLDPSEDNSEKIILESINENKNIRLIKMSRRFGQPAAMLAGIKEATLDYTVLIDVDLQDPPELIEKMYDKINEGYDTILAERSSKIGENIIRKTIATIGYYLISKLSESKIPMNVGEFRMISKKIVKYILEMEERDFFLRGANAYIGFKNKIIKFEREDRKDGQTKYNRFTGSLRIGLNGIFSFSTKPLHFITILSSLSFIVSSFIFILYLLLTAMKLFVFKYQFFVIILILLVSSLIFFSQGIIAEYLARIIPDIKKRPAYIIDKKYNFKEK